MPFPVEIPREETNDLRKYKNLIDDAHKALEQYLSPLFESYFLEINKYSQLLNNNILDADIGNPMIYTQKNEYILYMLLIEYSNQYWKPIFDKIPLHQKIIVLPRCITGPEFDELEVKRSKEGWHRITSYKTKESSGWKLVHLSKELGFQVYITMGRKFKEPNFLKVFRNLRKKYGYFGLITVACIPELIFGRTYIMEMGIPTQAVPLYFSGCAKWHGTEALQTHFPIKLIQQILGI